MTDDDQDRTGGAWIGKRPDENTKQVREGDQAGDDDIRNSGENH